MDAHERLRGDLKRVVGEVEERFSLYREKGVRLEEAMMYACEGGKRVRAFLVSEGVKYSGKEKLTKGEREARLDVMMAVEMVHAYSLVHDDLPCMDDDDWRRHRPTVHKAYDEATAVLCGDALLTLAFEVMASVPLSGESVKELVKVLARSSGYRGMVGGQVLDMAGTMESVEALREMQRLKTGELMACSLECGGIVGGASLEKRGYLRELGFLLGEMFQVVDDILDVEGADEETGKGKGRDEGKVTWYDFMKDPREEVERCRMGVGELVRGWKEEERVMAFVEILSKRKG